MTFSFRATPPAHFQKKSLRPALRTPPAQTRLLLLNKPYGVLAQFTDDQHRSTLKDFVNVADVYPAGRLDRDSEGLLLLTNNGQLQQRISNPRSQLKKTYWVQVEGQPSTDQLQQLCQGVRLNDGISLPAQARHLPEPVLWARDPPVRFRKNIPTHWLEVIVHEGRNRQVRRMTAAVGLPTLRLIRVRIGPWSLDDLAPGQWQEARPDLI